jgi:hypothetical protein
LIDCFANFCVENDLCINIGKTQALFVNGSSQMYVNSLKIDTVDEFKYLGLILSNKSSRPDILLKARMLKA